MVFVVDPTSNLCVSNYLFSSINFLNLWRRCFTMGLCSQPSNRI